MRCSTGGRLDLIDELYSPEMARGARRWIAPFRESFPDVQMKIVEGEKVGGRFRCSATHLGTWRASTHRPPVRAGRRGLHLPSPRRPNSRSLGHRGHPLPRETARDLAAQLEVSAPQRRLHNVDAGIGKPTEVPGEGGAGVVGQGVERVEDSVHVGTVLANDGVPRRPDDPILTAWEPCPERTGALSPLYRVDRESRLLAPGRRACSKRWCDPSLGFRERSPTRTAARRRSGASERSRAPRRHAEGGSRR